MDGVQTSAQGAAPGAPDQQGTARAHAALCRRTAVGGAAIPSGLGLPHALPVDPRARPLRRRCLRLRRRRSDYATAMGPMWAGQRAPGSSRIRQCVRRTAGAGAAAVAGGSPDVQAIRGGGPTCPPGPWERTSCCRTARTLGFVWPQTARNFGVFRLVGQIDRRTGVRTIIDTLALAPL